MNKPKQLLVLSLSAIGGMLFTLAGYGVATGAHANVAAFFPAGILCLAIAGDLLPNADSQRAEASGSIRNFDKQSASL